MDSALVYQSRPFLVGAVHLPPVTRQWFNDSYLSTVASFAIENVRAYRDGGFDAVYLQDSTPGHSASPEVIACMSALVTAVKDAVPDIALGVIVEANDLRASVAIASVGASFIRIKVFVGAMVKADGIIEGCSHQLNSLRDAYGTLPFIMADVYDRTGMPLAPLPIEEAARQAVNRGADSLVITGSSLEESIRLLNQVKQKNLGRPLFLGGGATADNVNSIKGVADGVIASSSLKATPPNTGWDPRKIAEFVKAAKSG